MRKITTEIIRAFRNRERKSIDNTRTDGNAIYLHGNKIAEWRGTELWITTANWPTATTKDRLNGLPGVRVHQHKYCWYLNGQRWGGEWTKV